MRISAWSSDVCSSDLDFILASPPAARRQFPGLKALAAARLHQADAGGRHGAQDLDDLCQRTRHPGAPGRIERRGSHRTGDRHQAQPMPQQPARSEEHTSELQSLMRISYAVFCLKKKKKQNKDHARSTRQTDTNTNTLKTITQ